MIAQIRVPVGDDDAYTLILNDMGEWTCSDWPAVAEAMNDAHMHEHDEAWKVQDAVRRLGGEITYLKS